MADLGQWIPSEPRWSVGKSSWTNQLWANDDSELASFPCPTWNHKLKLKCSQSLGRVITVFSSYFKLNAIFTRFLIILFSILPISCNPLQSMLFALWLRVCHVPHCILRPLINSRGVPCFLDLGRDEFSLNMAINHHFKWPLSNWYCIIMYIYIII